MAEHVRRLVGLGASIVEGTVSASLTDRLAARLGPAWQVVNAGRNGELAWNAALRVPDVIRSQPDVVFVLVGSNDVIASRGPREERLYRRMMKLPQPPTLAFYRDNLARIIDDLHAAPAQVLVCTLPFLGEDLASEVNAKITEYNDSIRELAGARGASVVDVHGALTAELHRLGGQRGRDLPRGMRHVITAMLLRRVLRWRYERIARRYGYVLLTDGIHLTDAAADVAAAAIEQAVRDLGP